MPYMPRLREHAKEKMGRMEEPENEESVVKRCLLETALRNSPRALWLPA